MQVIRTTDESDRLEATPSGEAGGPTNGLTSNERRTAMTTRGKCLFLWAVLPAVVNGQVLKITSFTGDPVTGNISLTWTNQPTNVYVGLLAAHSADDDSWLPAASPLWNLRTTNATTALPGMHFDPPMMFVKLICSTNPLSPPSFPQFPVPFANITVDGNTSDWAGILPALIDRAGDVYMGPPGSDITALYLARDSTRAYLRIDAGNGPPDSSSTWRVSFYTNYFAYAGDRFVDIDIDTCTVKEYTCSTSGGCWTNVASGAVAVQGSVIEASVPFSALNPPSPSYVRAYQKFDSTGIVEATFP